METRRQPTVIIARLLALLFVSGCAAPPELAARGAVAPSGGWLALHIALAVLAFALATTAAVAAVAVLLRERALKHVGGVCAFRGHEAGTGVFQPLSPDMLKLQRSIKSSFDPRSR